MRKFTLTLSEVELNVILNALAKRPLEESLGAFNAIQTQLAQPAAAPTVDDVG